MGGWEYGMAWGERIKPARQYPYSLDPLQFQGLIAAAHNSMILLRLKQRPFWCTASIDFIVHHYSEVLGGGGASLYFPIPADKKQGLGKCRKGEAPPPPPPPPPQDFTIISQLVSSD